MEVKICPNCEEQNLSFAWKCKKCKYDLSSVEISEIEATESTLIRPPDFRVEEPESIESSQFENNSASIDQIKDMTTVVCPKCGTENPSDAVNCRKCRIILKMALEHVEKQEPLEPSQGDEIDNEEMAKTVPLGKGIITAIIIGGIAGLVGGVIRPSLGYPFPDIGIFLHTICIPIAPLAGIISAIIVHSILDLDEDGKVPVFGRVIIYAIIGFLAGFLPFQFGGF